MSGRNQLNLATTAHSFCLLTTSPETTNIDGGSSPNSRVTEKPAVGSVLSRIITNGYNQEVTLTHPATANRFIHTCSEYNAKGQLTKHYQDTGSNTAKTAATLFEYDAFGNLVKQTLALSNSPTKDNSPVSELAFSVEAAEDGIYAVTTQTRYNAEGNALTNVQKQLISQLSATLENKTVSVSERGLTSANWMVYNEGVKRMNYSSMPTSDITAESVSVDGVVLSQTDTAGITTTATRSFTAEGMVLVQTNGRGNASTTVTDIAGRTVSVTDAAGNVTTTTYCTCCDQPATITDAQGNTTCYRYDERGRKVAEWGTGIQPALFGYDDADNLISLKTFRAGTETISSDPTERTDGDETTWAFDPATGLELRKTYADDSGVVKTYDAYNRLATETDARGNVKTHSYETARGLLLGTTYSDGTTARAYAYNHLGQLTQVTDDAGTRTIGYNTYGEAETDSLLAGGVTHLITETRDTLGRSTGFIYAKNGAVQHTVTTGYGTDGRIASAGFLHGGAEKQFGYSYVAGSNLLHKLTMPNNMTLTQSYEETRDLLIGMYYKRGTTGVVERTYTYDTLGRPLTRTTSRQGKTANDTFGYNTRSELTAATVSGENYGYDYDNIGNRNSATEGEDVTAYTANALNQYTAVGDFAPTFDADGNQTLVKTGTGIWSVVYNAENRPVSFTRSAEDGTTVIECSYDSMGRRAFKKVTTNGSVTLHQRYIYRGYLQIACCDLTRSAQPCLWLLTWDPTEQIATRPLAIQKNGTWYSYGWDFTKNICEIYAKDGYISTVYTYSPYGEVTEAGDVEQPILCSSEFFDIELGLTYYNYRCLNSYAGRWISRDQLDENDNINLYSHTQNTPVYTVDYLGLSTSSDYLASFLKDLPDSVGFISYSSRIAVFPVPVFPIVTVEIYAWVNGNIQQCCNEDDTLGLMLTGFLGMEVNGGVGTSVGGTSNVRTERGKKGNIRYRNGKGGGTGRGGSFSSAPTARNYGFNHRSVRSRSANVQNYVQLPKCDSKINLTFSVGISGFISGGADFLSVGYQFETTFAKCDIPGDCKFINPITSGSGGIVYGLGSGARIAVFGRGGANVNIQIA